MLTVVSWNVTTSLVFPIWSFVLTAVKADFLVWAASPFSPFNPVKPCPPGLPIGPIDPFGPVFPGRPTDKLWSPFCPLGPSGPGRPTPMSPLSPLMLVLARLSLLSIRLVQEDHYVQLVLVCPVSQPHPDSKHCRYSQVGCFADFEWSPKMRWRQWSEIWWIRSSWNLQKENENVKA